MGDLALERSDRPGLTSFLAGHLTCGGGTDVELLAGEDGAMIRVTCTDCGMAIEAPAASWDGWWEERTRDAGSPTRRFEPGRRRVGRRRPTRTSPRARSRVKIADEERWRQRLVTGVIAAWVTAGVVLFCVAILWR